jgi:hypothetical protein
MAADRVAPGIACAAVVARCNRRLQPPPKDYRNRAFIAPLNSAATDGINGLLVTLPSDRLHLVEACGAHPARIAALTGQRPEIFRLLHLPAFETESNRIMVHDALAGGVAGASGQALPISINWQAISAKNITVGR